jgi:hypothetical protein
MKLVRSTYYYGSCRPAAAKMIMRNRIEARSPRGLLEINLKSSVASYAGYPTVWAKTTNCSALSWRVRPTCA